jgi:hypothetical protein
MSVTYKIFTSARLVVTTGLGVVTLAESRAHQDKLLADPDFDPEFDQLIDFTAVSRFAPTADEAALIAERKLFSPRSRRAFVATDPAIYGMGRMIEVRHGMSATPSRVLSFYDLPSALKWLGREKLPE